MPATPIKQEPISFPNGNSATAFFPTRQTSAEELVSAMGLKPKAVILILGGADTLSPEIKPRLNQWFGRGIARAAIDAGAVIVDGGTKSGVMSLMGEGVANNRSQTSLIGVAPAGLVRYPGSTTQSAVDLEPNHSHFVLVDGAEWGSKSAMMFSIVNGLSATAPAAGSGTAPMRRPRLALLAGGGETTRKEVLQAVREKIPIIVLEGSGGVADEIVAAAKDRSVTEQDSTLAEILEDGDIRFHSLKRTVKGIHRLIISKLGSDKVLDQAWESFAKYDFNAGLQQKNFDKIQLAILIVGVIGTLLAVIKHYGPEDWDKNGIWWKVHHYVLVSIPILLTVLITAATRFKQGTKWLLLRAGAEAIKREIYRYRARAMYYREDPAFYLYRPDGTGSANPGSTPAPGLSPAQQLAKRVEEITLRTMRTEVNLSALKPYDNSNGFPPYCGDSSDDGYSVLSPDRYVTIRLENQLGFYQSKSLKLDRTLRLLYWLTFIVGGLSTLLAAIGFEIWIALATVILSAFGTYLGYRQIETTLTKYNQAATDLSNVRSWWHALSPDEQAQQVNIDSLVEHTEQVLQSELDGWIQQMQNALAELRKGQEPPAEREENKGPNEGNGGAADRNAENGEDAGDSDADDHPDAESEGNEANDAVGSEGGASDERKR